MSNHISILQWRESGDDDDTVDVRVYPSDEDANHLADSLNEYAIEPDSNDDLEDPAYFHIWDCKISDGDILTSKSGRKFKISITEV